MSIRIDDLALEEARSEIRYYMLRNVRAGQRLLDELERAFVQIEQHPQRFPLLETIRRNDRYRRIRLRRFPLIVVYELLGDATPYVVAVAHTSRQPDYWRARLKRKG
jgi:plasmid stabilization system protein ParE